eukprot:Gb_40683 [translate_table: standard]
MAQRRLADKVAIITGAANGIGAATARLFAREGAFVYVCDIDDEAGQKLCADVEGTKYVHCDVAKEDDIKSAVALAVEEKGAVDIMLNNAGCMHHGGHLITEVSFDAWSHVVAVNLNAVMLGIKHAARVMIPRGGGCILVNGSVFGLTKTTDASHAYVTTKHGVLGLVKSAAVELGRHGIRVNAVSAYGVVTKMLEEWIRDVSDGQCSGEMLQSEFDRQATFQGKRLTVEDVAQAFLFLASDETAGYMNGSNLVLDGGYTVQGRDMVLFKGPPPPTTPTNLHSLNFGIEPERI